MRLRVTGFSMLIAIAAVSAASAALLLGQAPAAPAGRGGAAPAAPAGRGGAAAAPAAPAGRGGAAPAQGRGAAPAGPVIPRTADGHPDFSGVWQVLDNGIDGNIEPHAASWGVRAGQGVIVDPPDGKIPYKPEAMERRQANYKNRAEDPVSRCWKPGVPRINYIPFPFQITQSPKMIQMTYEFVHSYRSVYINDSTHLAGIDFFNGDSRAKWEGDTLVVDVANFNDDPTRPTWLDGSGNYHSDALHVVERYTFNGPDMITYRATLDDSKVYARPFTIEVVLYRHKEKNFRLLEYECQVFKEQLVKDGKGDSLRDRKSVV
jgi:hypothetical protein